MAILLTSECWSRPLGTLLILFSMAGHDALVSAIPVWAPPHTHRRRIFIAVVSVLLRIPLLQLVGGLALIWIAVRLVRPGHMDHAGTRHGTSLREAIWIIVVADVTIAST